MFREVDYGKLKIISAFINKPNIYLITFNPFLKKIDGKTLVSYPNPSTTYNFALKLKRKHNLNIVETPFNTEIGPLLSQEADIGLILDPNFTMAMMNRAILLEDFTKIPFAFTGFCSFKEQKKFIESIKKAIKIFNTDEKATINVAKKYFPMSEDVLKKAISNIRKADFYSTKFTMEEIKNALDLKSLEFEKYKNRLQHMIKRKTI